MISLDSFGTLHYGYLVSTNLKQRATLYYPTAGVLQLGFNYMISSFLSLILKFDTFSCTVYAIYIFILFRDGDGALKDNFNIVV